jgi:hypothetical protein
MAISYSAVGATAQSESVSIMFAARPGNEEGAGMCLGTSNTWWCGDYNPSTDAAPFKITSEGIKYN